MRDAARSQTGNYAISVQRLNDPVGCSALAFDASTLTGAIAAGESYDGEIDCYTSWAPEAGARELRVEATSGMLEPVVEVLRPDGSPRCVRTNPDGWFDCYGEQYEYQRILVYDASGMNAGNYEIDRR